MPSTPANPLPPAQRKSSPLAILEAAERLFGQYGHEGVSIRQVNLAAGMGNNSAVAYHFGDKAGLIKAIFEWRLPALEQRRAALMEEARREDKLSDPRTLINIMLRPFYDLVDGEGKRTHAMFMHQMMRSAEGRAIRVGLTEQSPISEQVQSRFATCLPELSRELLSFRSRLGAITFLDTVCDPNFSSLDGATEQALLDELLDMVTAMCVRAPVHDHQLFTDRLGAEGGDQLFCRE